ncbi:hypothetical protein Ga0100230_006005 [Opitutaceae bacterium TAV3]|nr:hypothetical protein Ga0100230_006005 [Opitutaceae bacterium TAV3]
MNAPLSVMRGGEPVTLPQAAAWIAPAPLTIHDRITLTIPPTTPNGDYLLLAPATENNGWLGQPIHVIPPLAVTPPTLKWPADAPSPHLTTTLTSHTTTPLTTRLAVALNDTRDQFLDPAPMQPGETRPINIPLPNLTPGKRHRGQLTIDSRHAGRRDQITRQLDITLLASHRLPSPAAHPDWDWNKIAPIDFSTWDPFGGPIAPEDCSATLQSAWSPAGLHLRIVVRDDEHLNTHATTTPNNSGPRTPSRSASTPTMKKPGKPTTSSGSKATAFSNTALAGAATPPTPLRTGAGYPTSPISPSEPASNVSNNPLRATETSPPMKSTSPGQPLASTSPPPPAPPSASPSP